jgi:hypothetical protein
LNPQPTSDSRIKLQIQIVINPRRRKRGKTIQTNFPRKETRERANIKYEREEKNKSSITELLKLAKAI